MQTLPVYCLPYTGTSASCFYAWQRRLPDWIAIRPIELAGRGDRMDEPFYDFFDEAVEDIERQIRPGLSTPYMLLGHCMGAVLCYELAVRLRQDRAPLPCHLMAIGQGAPARRCEFARLASLPDSQLIQKVREMGGDPEGRLDDPELSAFFLPVLRADCRIYDDYAPSNQRLECPIAVIGGRSDALNPPAARWEWRDYTISQLTVQQMDGGHYFAEDHTEEILASLLDIARRYAGPSGGTP